jgi:hypothetical protein
MGGQTGQIIEKAITGKIKQRTKCLDADSFGLTL